MLSQPISTVISAWHVNPLWHLWVFSMAGFMAGMLLHYIIVYLPIVLRYRWLKLSFEYLSQSDLAPTVKIVPPPLLTSPRYCLNCLMPSIGAGKLPLLAYLFNQRHCCDCRQPIDYRYPTVECFTALITVFICSQPQVITLLGAKLLLCYLLIILMFIDFYELLLPDELTLLLLWLGLLFNLDTTFIGLDSAVLGAISGYLSLWGFYWLAKLMTGKEGLGYGDFKLMAGLGACVGWQMLDKIIVIGSSLGLLAALIIFVCYDKTVVTKPLPLGGYLSLAGLMMICWF